MKECSLGILTQSENPENPQCKRGTTDVTPDSNGLSKKREKSSLGFKLEFRVQPLPPHHS